MIYGNMHVFSLITALFMIYGDIYDLWKHACFLSYNCIIMIYDLKSRISSGNL